MDFAALCCDGVALQPVNFQLQDLYAYLSELSYSSPESNHPVMLFLTRVSDVVRSGLRRHFQAGFQYHCRNDHLQTRRGWVEGVGEVFGHARLLADGDRRNQDRSLLQHINQLCIIGHFFWRWLALCLPRS